MEWCDVFSLLIPIDHVIFTQISHDMFTGRGGVILPRIEVGEADCSLLSLPILDSCN